MERSGIVLDDFNAGLEIAKGKGNELDYVLGVMSETGGQSFLDTYKEMNGVMFENQQAQADLELQTAKLSETLAPITTIIMTIVAEIIKWMNNNKELSQIILVVLGALTALAGIFAVLGPIIAGITSLAGALGVGIAAILTPVGWVVAAIAGLIAIVALLKAAWEPLTKFFDKLWGGITKAFEKSWASIKKGFEGLVGFVKKPLNSLIKLVNKAINGVNKIKLPDWLGGHGINIPTIPMLARGTDYFRGGLAIVGERGPELVQMPTGARVHNNDDTMSMLGGGVQTFEVTIPVQIDGRTIAQKTAKFTNREIFNLTQQKKRGGRK